MDWQWFLTILPSLLFLACPLAMFWLMRGMSHGDGCGSKAAKGDGAAPATVPLSDDDEIRVLRERLARLEAQGRRSTATR